MRKIIIAGTSSFSLVLFDLITKEKQGNVVAFTLNEEYIVEKKLAELPIVAFEKLDSLYDMQEIEILLSFGYSNLNAIREQFYCTCKEKGYTIGSFISRNASIYSNELGEGNLILPNSYVGPYSQLGNCNIIWNGVNISHHNCIGDFNHISAGSILAGNVKIGNNCFLGVNSAYKNGVIIASKTLIGAASYVSKNTKENVAYSGNPARSIKGCTALDIIKLV